ncbi:MAG: outer membrane lipoprotein-sorting protein [Spirochaetaceae bacterium]|jgi:outer membrane lipoprotein-sorting protein|nr:outer membrane lipoprotein-sorting protein [Spirochaetaceae bacterium]
MNRMKRVLLLTAAAAACFAGTAAAQNTVPAGVDAAAIVKESRNLVDAETVSTRSRMVITAKDGRTSERIIDQYSKEDSGGRVRTVVVFQQPASVRNTRFLTMENAAGGDDRWIFLPSLGKVRRIASSEGGGSFMGTDFAYDDMSLQTRGAEKDAHRLLREESLNGKACYVIESVSGDSGFLYSKYIQWIDKEIKIPWKAELYDRRSNLIKLMEVLEVKEVQGQLTPNITKMTTVAEGTSTMVYMDIIKYNDPVPEGVFTTNYLETGRAR